MDPRMNAGESQCKFAFVRVYTREGVSRKINPRMKAKARTFKLSFVRVHSRLPFDGMRRQS